jgi:hypothetical protein
MLFDPIVFVHRLVPSINRHYLYAEPQVLARISFSIATAHRRVSKSKTNWRGPIPPAGRWCMIASTS